MRLVRNSGRMRKGAPQFLGRAEGRATVADGTRQSAGCGRAESRRSRADLRLVRQPSLPRFSFMCVWRERESICTERERERERDAPRDVDRPKYFAHQSPQRWSMCCGGVQLFVHFVLDSRTVGTMKNARQNVPILSFVVHSSYRTLCCFVLFLVVHQSGDLISDLRSMHKPMKDWFLK